MIVYDRQDSEISKLRNVQQWKLYLLYMHTQHTLLICNECDDQIYVSVMIVLFLKCGKDMAKNKARLKDNTINAQVD